MKRRLMTKSPRRPITLVPPPEDPVKRRLLKKTDMRNDESVMNVDKDLFFVVNTLTKDEGHEMPKLTVLDNHEEMMKGRQKELNSLREMGAMTVVKGMKQLAKERFKHDGADREKDGRVKSRLVLKGLQSMSGAHTARDVFTNTIDTVSQNNAGCELYTTETAIQSQTTSQLQLTYTHHSCTRMSTKICVQNHQNQTSGMTQD